MELALECFALIGVITGGLIWYAIVVGHREDGEAGIVIERRRTIETLDPDAHLGHSGAE